MPPTYVHVCTVIRRMDWCYRCTEYRTRLCPVTLARPATFLSHGTLQPRKLDFVNTPLARVVSCCCTCSFPLFESTEGSSDGSVDLAYTSSSVRWLDPSVEFCLHDGFHSPGLCSPQLVSVSRKAKLPGLVTVLYNICSSGKQYASDLPFSSTVLLLQRLPPLLILDRRSGWTTSI